MMRIRELLNGKREAGEWLCRTCSHVHIQKGYAESEELILCAHFWFDNPQRLPFKIRECTLYSDKRRSDLSDMKETALILDTPKVGRAAGFVDGVELKKGECDETGAIPEKK